jgi:hypothetical protein
MAMANVVLQLPHDLHKPSRSWLRDRVTSARAQLRDDCSSCELTCFWWSEVGQPLKLGAAALDDWRNVVCAGRFVDFARDVALHHSQLLRELRVPDVPRWYGPTKRRWQWFYADVAFILTAHHRAELFAGAARVWYLEWDVAWTGSLGTILHGLQAVPRMARGRSREFGYGLHALECFDCNSTLRRDWQGCLPGAWGAFGNVSHYLARGMRRPRLCSGLIQLVWYSPRLLRLLYDALQAGERHYCEAFAATLCSHSSWCRVDVISRDPARRKLFGHFSWKAFHARRPEELVPPHNGRPMLFHPVKNPAWEGLVPKPPWGHRGPLPAWNASNPRRYSWQREYT